MLKLFQGIAILWSAMRSLLITAVIFTAMNVILTDNIHVMVFGLVFAIVWIIDLAMCMVLGNS